MSQSSQANGMPSCGVRLYLYDYPSGGVIPSSVSSLTNGVEVPQVREATCEGDDHGRTVITHLNSMDFHEEVVPGWGKAKTCTATVVYNETVNQTIQNMRPTEAQQLTANSRGRRVLAVVYPDGAAMLSIAFLATVGEQIPAAGNDDPITVPITFNLSGKRKFVDVA